MDEQMIVVGERLARIETKIDMVLDVTGDHEQRIRALESGHEDLARVQASPLRVYALPLSMLATLVAIVVTVWSTFHHH